MNYTILNKLESEHFEQMYALELSYYDAQFITPASEAYAWYKKYPYSVIAIASAQGQIVGFINLFPVKAHIFQEIERGTFNDAMLTTADIVDITASKEPLHMFLSCIVVSDAVRGQGVTQLLLLAAIEQYKHVQHRCQSIITDNVTEEGQRFSKKYGFTKQQASTHDSFIYKQRYLNFVNAVELQTNKAHCDP